MRFGDRSRERPLRSNSREKKVEHRNRGIFQTQEEQDAHLRRIRLLAETAPEANEKKSGGEQDSGKEGEKDVEWLNQVSSGGTRRSNNSNSD